MISRLFPFLLSTVVLVSMLSCVGTKVDAGLNALVGENVKTAFLVMGYPSKKLELGDETVYSWIYSHGGAMPMPRTAQSTSYVGSQVITTTTSYNQMVPFDNYCEIKIVADKTGTVRTWEYDGNNGGLMAYSRRLSAYSKSKKPATSGTLANNE